MVHHAHAYFSDNGLIFAMGFVLASILAYSLRHGEASARLDILRFPSVLGLLKKRPFQFALQLPFVLLFFLIIAAGIFGSQRPGANLSTVVVWTIWWTGIVAVTLFAGKLWCSVCPWAALGDWVQRLALWKRRSPGLSLDMKWPVRLRNLYPAIFLFLVLTWAEFQFHLVSSPRGTANLAVVILFLTVLSALIYERRSFCRYMCPIGAMLGLYAMSSSFELRARDRAVCRNCSTKDCVNGNPSGYGCPVLEYPEAMDVNTYCVLCTECIKTCPYDNIAMGPRPFAAEITRPVRKRLDEGLLAVVVLGVVVFHSFTMIDPWFAWLDFMKDRTTLSPEAIATLSLVFTVVATGGLYLVFALITRGMVRDRRVSFGEVFASFSYALIPLALCYHIAHNIMHILMEVPKVTAVFSDPFGWNQAQMASSGMLLSRGQIEFFQTLIVIAGLWLGLRVAATAAWGLRTNRVAAFAVQALMIGCITLFYGWILTQPMMMRMG